MMSAATGGSVKVTGNSMAMVATGPRPGSTPTSVPSNAPTRQNNRFCGVMATLKPKSDSVRDRPRAAHFDQTGSGSDKPFTNSGQAKKARTRRGTTAVVQRFSGVA